MPPVTTPADTSGMTGQQADAFQLLVQQFHAYGLDSLVPDIRNYIIQGYSGPTISLMLRQTQAYRDRFPAMEVLAQQGHAIDERNYIDYEVTARRLEVQNGLPTGMISDPQNVARLLIGNVDAADLTERVKLNRSVSMDAPPELKATLRDYYGIDGDAAVAAYYLEPDHSLAYLQNMAATAKIGAAARRQSIGFDLNAATALAQRGVSEQEAQQGFQQVAAMRGLQAGAGETIDQATLVDAAFGDANASTTVQRVVGGRAAQFQGGGGAQETNTGVSGLGGRR